MRYPQSRAKPEVSPWINGLAERFYGFYHAQLAGLATTRFQWVGLPPSVDPMMLESVLCLQGGLAVFTHVRSDAPLGPGMEEAERGRFTVVRAAASGPLDDLFRTAGYQTYGPRGGLSKRLSTTGPIETWGGVPIWGDSLRMNYEQQTIELWSEILARAALVVITNLINTTNGVILSTSQDNLQSKQIALETTLSGIPTLITDPALLDGIKTLDLGVHPDTVKSAHEVSLRLQNESRAALGVSVSANEKNERLTDDEVQAATAITYAARMRAIQPRMRAAELINQRYFEGDPVVAVVDPNG